MLRMLPGLELKISTLVSFCDYEQNRHLGFLFSALAVLCIGIGIGMVAYILEIWFYANANF